MSREISQEEAKKLVEEGAQLVDVRVGHEWEAGRIPGALHIPLDQLAERTGELDADRPVVVYCRGGTRSSMAADALEAAGYDAAKMSGGIVEWADASEPLEPPEGYVAESGEAAARIQARKQAAGD